MLKIYICPECSNFRIVSRRTDAKCLHCGINLKKTDLTYTAYTNMDQSMREDYRTNFKMRMMDYQSRLSHNEDQIN